MQIPVDSNHQFNPPLTGLTWEQTWNVVLVVLSEQIDLLCLWVTSQENVFLVIKKTRFQQRFGNDEMQDKRFRNYHGQCRGRDN